MATQQDVRRIALALPGTAEGGAHGNPFAFSVTSSGKAKGYAWTWMERVEPKKPRVPNPDVLAVRVPNLGQKDALLAAEPRKFFTEPHYNGYPAVLVRLAEVSVADLRVLLEEGWRCQGGSDLAGEPATRARAASGSARGPAKRTRRRRK